MLLLFVDRLADLGGLAVKRASRALSVCPGTGRPDTRHAHVRSLRSVALPGPDVGL